MVDRRDKHIPLEDRVRRALGDTCDAHEPRGGCFACGRRFEAVMRAFAYELDLISRHDAVVATVVRDRITESKKAARYRLAWLSAKQGRSEYRHLFVCEQDRVERAEEHYEWDLKILSERMRHWKLKSERYRLAWKSACQGRKRWRELYLAALNFPARLNDMSFVRAAHRNAVAVRRLSLEKAALEQIRTTLQDDHVTAWTRVRELEAELSDLRLAFSEQEGAQTRAQNPPAI